MSHSRHRYLSPSPTAQNPLFTKDDTQSKAVSHLSTKKSGHLALCPKSWVGSPANQVRAWIIPHPLLLLTTLQDQVGRGAPEIDHTAVPKVSPLPAASDQALWALWQVITLFVPMPCHSPMMKKMLPVKMKMPRQTRVGQRPQVMARWYQMAKRGRYALKLKTPSPALAKSSVHTRTPTPRRRSSPSSESGAQQALRRTAPPRNPGNHLLRKSRPQMRHSAMRPGKELGSWTHILMLGFSKKLLKVSRAGPPETP